MTIPQFQKIILDWYRENRRDLPWRKTKNPYKILVSEIMLQQTQVTRVIPKYEEFLKAFPTLEALARAPDKKLLQVWSGLGYWRRAKYLKETAKFLTRARTTNSQTSPGRQEAQKTNFENRGGRSQLLGFDERLRRASLRAANNRPGRASYGFSSEPRELEKLPGIGPYTARALACFAFGSKEAFVDTNIRRVYLHLFFPKRRRVSDREILPIAKKAIASISSHGKKLKYPGITPREWHYALFDYGAIVLKNKKINRQSRHYHKQSRFVGSFRSFRTKAVRFLLTHPLNKVRHKTLTQFLQKTLREANSPYSAAQIIHALLKDNLIKKSRTHHSL